jgi:aromatic-amino-acid transaminase
MNEVFRSIEPAPADPILGLTEAYRADTHPDKVNLGVGVYKDENGQTPVLESVRRAEAMILDSQTTKSYLPIPGDPLYGQCVRRLLFGLQHELAGNSRAVTAHTPGGTGALSLGASWLKSTLPDAVVRLSRPTWANHRGVFGAAGFPLEEYPYYDADAHDVDEAALLDAFASFGTNDIAVLHVSCHNPTGCDLSAAAWRALAESAARNGWIPFLDFAYQGFGQGLEKDREPITPFVEAGVPFLIASSFSKNVSLYRDRVGALTVVAESPEQARTLFSRIKAQIRVVWSNPPAHGGLIVQSIFDSTDLTDLWKTELAAMRHRILSMREQLVAGLRARCPDRDFSFMERQLGMFSMSGLTKKQVQWLRDERHIYIVGSGRINVAGLLPDKMDLVCDAVAEAIATA